MDEGIGESEIEELVPEWGLFIYPPHRRIAATLPWETGKCIIITYTGNIMCG